MPGPKLCIGLSATISLLAPVMLLELIFVIHQLLLVAGLPIHVIYYCSRCTYIFSALCFELQVVQIDM